MLYNVEVELEPFGHACIKQVEAKDQVDAARMALTQARKEPDMWVEKVEKIVIVLHEFKEKQVGLFWVFRRTYGYIME